MRGNQNNYFGQGPLLSPLAGIRTRMPKRLILSQLCMPIPPRVGGPEGIRTLMPEALLFESSVYSYSTTSPYSMELNTIATKSPNEKQRQAATNNTPTLSALFILPPLCYTPVARVFSYSF